MFSEKLLLFKDLPNSPDSGGEKFFPQSQKEQLKQEFREIRKKACDVASSLKIEAVRLYGETRVLFERAKFLRDLFGGNYENMVKQKALGKDDFEKLKKIFEMRLKEDFAYIGLRVTHEGVFILWLSPDKKIESQSLSQAFDKTKSARILKFIDHDLVRRLEALKFVRDNIVPYVKEGNKNWNAEVFWRSEMVNDELTPMLLEAAENDQQFTFKSINGGFVLINKQLGDFKFLRKDYDSNFNFIRPKVDVPDFSQKEPTKPVSLSPQYFQRERQYLDRLVSKHSEASDDPRDTENTKMRLFLTSADDDGIAEFEYEINLLISVLVGQDKGLLKIQQTIEDEARIHADNDSKDYLNPYNVSSSNFASEGEGAREKMLLLNKAFQIKAMVYDQKKERL